MGLDVYLYERKAAEAKKLHFEATDAFYERPDYAELTEEQRKEARAALPPYVSHEDVPSEKYPDHLFNRRYLRSSYNAGGFNSAVPDMIGEDHGLYWVFEPMGREWDGDEGFLTMEDVPKLRECRERAEQVAAELRKCDPLRTSAETPIFGAEAHLWSDLPTEEQVLDWYRAEKAQNSGRTSPFGGNGYTTAKGAVFGFESGIEILALTLGRDIIGRPAAVMVYRLSTETRDSYIQSAEITGEFIDEAIQLIERDGSAYISWSG